MKITAPSNCPPNTIRVGGAVLEFTDPPIDSGELPVCDTAVELSDSVRAALESRGYVLDEPKRTAARGGSKPAATDAA